jgi:type IV secretory pathway VirB10-like protein
VALISGDGSEEESAFLHASESGDEVFSLTNACLPKAGLDAAFDVYDAHVCNAPPSPAKAEAKASTEAQPPAKALKARKKQPKHKRSSCEAQARKRHATKRAAQAPRPSRQTTHRGGGAHQ